KERWRQRATRLRPHGLQDQPQRGPGGIAGEERVLSPTTDDIISLSSFSAIAAAQLCGTTSWRRPPVVSPGLHPAAGVLPRCRFNPSAARRFVLTPFDKRRASAG